MKTKKFFSAIIMMVIVMCASFISCAGELGEIPDLTDADDPYLYADTTMSVKDGKLSCKLRILKVTPKALNQNDTTFVTQRTLGIAEIGSPGSQTLKVISQEMTSNTYDIGEITTESGGSNDFYWEVKRQPHTFNAQWFHDGVEVGHSDELMAVSTTFSYIKGAKEYKYDFITELKVIQNEVIFEETMSTEPNYLGTRVLTVEGWCNGNRFTTKTGKTILLQHE